MRRLLALGIVGVCLSGLSAVVIGRHMPASIPPAIVGEQVLDVGSLGLASSVEQPEVSGLHGNARGELAATLSDFRIVQLAEDGTRSFGKLERTRSSVAKVLFSGRYRWKVAPPRATLIDESGATIRSVVVPPFTKGVAPLANGGLAFVTPGASNLITVMNRFWTGDRNVR